MKRDDTNEVLRVAHIQSRIVHSSFPIIIIDVITTNKSRDLVSCG